VTSRTGQLERDSQIGESRIGLVEQDRQIGTSTGKAGQAGRDNRMGQAEQDNHNEQVALDRKKMTGRTGLPEQVS
jgi:hypothetical protein